MSIKKKYSKIDQSKLPKSIVDVLKGIERKTDNFTDKKANKIFEPQLNNLIKGLKAKHPQSLTAKPVKAIEPKQEDTKPNEKIEAALNDVKKSIKSASSRSIERDSKRKALPAGKRISGDGNVYYENRDNRSDRNAPNFPKNKPYLKGGGETDTIASVIFYANNSNNGKIKTNLGDKTLIAFRRMILDDDYDDKDIAIAIFDPNKKNNRISTGWGTKSLSGLEAMIERARK